MNIIEALRVKINEANLTSEAAWRDDRESLIQALNPLDKMCYNEAVEKLSPSIQDLPLIKAAQFIEVLKPHAPALDDKATAELLEYAKEKLEATHYLKRLSTFSESLRRTQQRYGVSPTPILSLHHEKACDVGVSNNCRRAKANLEADLALAKHSEPIDKLKDLNSIVDLKPNIFGIGVNLNAIISKLKGGA